MEVVTDCHEAAADVGAFPLGAEDPDLFVVGVESADAGWARGLVGAGENLIPCGQQDGGVLVLGAEGEGGGGDRTGQEGVVGLAASEDDKLGSRERFGAGLGVAVDVGGEGLEGGDGQLVEVRLIVLDALEMAPSSEDDAAKLVLKGGAVELAWEAVG